MHLTRILVTGFLLMMPAPSEKVTIKSTSPDLIEPIVMPKLFFERESGPELSNGIHICKQETEYRELKSVRYPVFILECEGTKLALKEISLQ